MTEPSQRALRSDAILQAATCDTCGSVFPLTKWQRHTRNRNCPTCSKARADSRARAAEERRLNALTSDPERSKGYSLALHLQRVWR